MLRVNCVLWIVYTVVTAKLTETSQSKDSSLTVTSIETLPLKPLTF